MTVHVDDVGAATVVTMAWTAKRNALGPAEADLLADALREAGKRRGSVVVVTGEGAFCAGGDLPTNIELTRTMTPQQIQRRADLASLVASPATKAARSPSSSATVLPCEDGRSRTTTAAPWLCGSRTVASPRPEAPPVTTATLPAVRMCFSLTGRSEV